MLATRLRHNRMDIIGARFGEGPLPPEVQSYVSFAAGASTKPAQAGAAKALLKFLNSAAVAPVFKG